MLQDIGNDGESAIGEDYFVAFHQHLHFLDGRVENLLQEVQGFHRNHLLQQLLRRRVLEDRFFALGFFLLLRGSVRDNDLRDFASVRGGHQVRLFHNLPANTCEHRAVHIGGNGEGGFADHAIEGLGIHDGGVFKLGFRQDRKQSVVGTEDVEIDLGALDHQQVFGFPEVDNRRWHLLDDFVEVLGRNGDGAAFANSRVKTHVHG